MRILLCLAFSTLFSLGCGGERTTPSPSSAGLTTNEGAAEAAAQEAAAPPTPPPVAVPKAARAAARHILIPYDGAKGAPYGKNLSRDEAKAKAESLREEVLRGGDLAALARKHSSDASAARGGFLGSAEPGAWVKPFEEAVWSVPIGELTPVVETEFGFHVIRREALDEIRLRHVVVQHAGARGVAKDSPAATRTREEAQAIGEEALAALTAGEPFDGVAARLSDGPMAKHGGDLGWFLRGELGPAFDEAAFALPVGGRSALIETPFGLHIIERVE
ncbi:peptidyl-prolyl cis-trans isomerase [Myxococcota bacterium]|nr:peptidyl-prolyl cis-trans isomerase [Myxococcota bacterium]